MDQTTRDRLSREQISLLERADEAWNRKNYKYVISLYRRILLDKPDLIELRNRLHEAQLKNIGGVPSVFRRLQAQCTVVFVTPVIAKLQKENRYPEALNWAERCMTIDPTAPACCILLAQTADAAGLPELARAVLEFSREHNPKDLTLLEQLAANYVRAEMPEDALNAYVKLEELDPDNKRWKQLARNTAAGISIEHMEEGDVLSQDVEDQPEDTEGIMESAEHVARNLSETTRTFRDMLRNEKEAEILEHSGRTHGTPEGRALLIQHKKEQLQANPTAEVYVELAGLYYQDGSFGNAINAYKKSMDLAAYSDPEIMRAIIRIQCEKIENEIDRLSSAMAGLEAQRQTELKKTIQKLENEILETRIFGLENILRRYPTDYEGCFELAKLYSLCGQYKQAIRLLQRAQRSPKYRDEVATLIAQTFAENDVDDLDTEEFRELLDPE